MYGIWHQERAKLLLSGIDLPQAVVAEHPASGDAVFYPDDNGHKMVDPPGVRVFMRSMPRERESARLIPFPAFPHRDWPGNGNMNWGDAVIRKRVRPWVGFCGVAHRPSERRLAIDSLSESPHVEMVTVRRDAFLHPDRAAYVGSILNALLTVCARGVGMFSYRLYETMSLGRIPLIIDGGEALPFARQIDWESCAVFARPETAAADLLEWYEDVTDCELRDMQHAARQVWLEWLSPSGWAHKCVTHYLTNIGETQ
jgi:hypothetical protein